MRVSWRKGNRSVLVAAALAGAALPVGCSTTETPPEAPVAPLPAMLSVPQPAGTDLADIRNLFYDPSAPSMDSLKTCDAPFRKLQAATRSRDELSEGIREMVRQDPVRFHWCFYSKILSLETALKGELYVEERQKLVLDAYEFLTPVARVFMSDFRDSRYLRWAIYRYQKLSEWVFFRRVEPSAKETEELVDTANPLGLVRGGSNVGDASSILDRYHISVAPVSVAPAPDSASTRAPAAAASSPAPAPAPGVDAPAPADSAAPEPVSDTPFKSFSAIDPGQQPAPAAASDTGAPPAASK